MAVDPHIGHSILLRPSDEGKACPMRRLAKGADRTRSENHVPAMIDGRKGAEDQVASAKRMLTWVNA